jgi:octaprenyl-diphosphate synthase
LLRHAIEHGEVQRLPEIVDIVRRSGALDATREAARREAELARACAAHLPASTAREALIELCARAVDRSS